MKSKFYHSVAMRYEYSCSDYNRIVSLPILRFGLLFIRFVGRLLRFTLFNILFMSRMYDIYLVNATNL
ncbi:hypothetical protein [Rhodocytophaga aerolata]|uniref:hypothetical protein n=1 Tax=Rhodocytophaga aerolata TaxID=455078 RepID=UPI00366E82C3